MTLREVDKKIDQWTDKHLPRPVKWFVKWINPPSLTTRLLRVILVFVVGLAGFCVAYPRYFVGLVKLLRNLLVATLVMAFATNINAQEQLPPAIIAIVKKDIVSWTTNNSGVGTIVMKDGTKYQTFVTDSDTYLITDSGVYRMDPKIATCGEIIFALIILGIGAYMFWRLKVFCDTHLGTNAPPPPTNPPPVASGNGPNSLSSMTSLTTSGSSVLGQDTLVLPSGWGQTIDTNTTIVDGGSISTNGWTDWQSNTYFYVYWTTVTNTLATNSTQSRPCYLQSSYDLKTWANESLTVTGWVSGAPLLSGGFAQSNSVVVTYDRFGVPYETNWYSFSTNGEPTVLWASGPPGGLPVEPGAPAKFFRLRVP